jgi:hypothetical protein
MSFTIMSRVRATDIHPAGTKLVAVMLAMRCDDFGGSLFPSLATIASDASISRDQARRHVNTLVESDVLLVVSKATQHKTPRYRFNLEKLSEVASTQPLNESRGGADATPENAQGWHGCNSGVAPVQSRGGTGATLTPITTISGYGGTTPTGSAAKPPPLGVGEISLPAALMPANFDALVSNGKRTQGRIDALVKKSHELVAQGHDVNALASQALERGWATFALPPKPKATPTHAQRSTGRKTAQAKARQLGSDADWGMPT